MFVSIKHIQKEKNICWPWDFFFYCKTCTLFLLFLCKLVSCYAW